MALTAVCSKVVILLLIQRLLLLPLCVGIYVRSLLCDLVLGVFSSFAIILLRKRELVALLTLCSCFCVDAQELEVWSLIHLYSEKHLKDI